VATLREGLKDQLDRISQLEVQKNEISLELNFKLARKVRLADLRSCRERGVCDYQDWKMLMRFNVFWPFDRVRRWRRKRRRSRRRWLSGSM
jgi:hypothetical protein